MFDRLVPEETLEQLQGSVGVSPSLDNSRHPQAYQLRAYLADADQATMAADPAYPAWRAWAQRRLEALDPLTALQPLFALLGPYQSGESPA